MFDRLIDFIVQFWEKIWPITVITKYQKGVVLRLGKFNRTLTAGWYVTIPFIDDIMVHHVVVTTINLPSQSITTKDNKSIVVKGVVKYKIADIKTFLLEVFDAVDAVSDMSQAIIKKTIMEKTWDECCTNDLDENITKKARLEAKKWGVEIITVTLTDIGQIRSIKLFNDTSVS